ncbi:tetratricopeptide repeat protein [Chthonobacter albigriseus]|uniref:tetratricopeptide repeat protein n=1 Tax=Chthonobacter albigriseus TaxID=1683161 RepID=UPI0015EE632D|nr:tetratricopeptide repeat protein [Chthonobacter albigriseus]
MRGVTIAAAVALVAAGLYVERFPIGRLLAAAGAPGVAAVLFDDPAWKGAAFAAAGRGEAAVDALRRTRSPEAAYNMGNALVAAGDYPLAVKAYALALARNPDDADARINKGIVERLIAAAQPPPDEQPGGGSANSGARIDHDPSAMDTSDPDAKAKSATGDGMVGNREGTSDEKSAGSGKVDRKGSGAQDETEAGAGTASGAATDAAGTAGKGGGQTDSAASEEADKRRTPGASEREAAQATLQWLAAIPDDPTRWLKVKIADERDRRVKAGVAVQPGGTGW